MNKIFCFSGTGNSLYAANRISSEINAEVVNMKSGGECDADVIGIVFPVYFFGLPKTVERFLGELRVTNKNAYIFTVITKGGFAAGADSTVNELLKKRGASLSYSAKIAMVRNYLPEFKVNDSKALWERIDRRLDRVISDIKRRAVSRISPYNALNKAMHQNYPPLKTDCGKLFTVNGCRHCGTCAFVCPNGNITMENGLPKFGSGCELCFGCVHICPANAIDFNNKTQGKKRYKNHMQYEIHAFNANGFNRTRFKADYTKPRNKITAAYITNEYSFTYESGFQDSSVMINCLELGIDSETGTAQQISGYHPYVSWKPAVLVPPEAREGALVMTDKIESGITYQMKDNVTTYYDKSNGWLCIGARDYDGADCVRFCANCVAVVKDGLLSAIWVSLPTDDEVMKRLKGGRRCFPNALKA